MKKSPEQLSIDRLPPHSAEAEEGVLGCCLLAPRENVNEVQAKIGSLEVFYDLRNQCIYEEMTWMMDEQIPIDIITLQQRLKDGGSLDKIGGIPYLNKLIDNVPSAGNLNHYLEMVMEKYIQRKLISTCTGLVRRVYEHKGPVAGLMDDVERQILAIRPNQTASSDIKALVHEAINKIEQKCQSAGNLTGLATGLADLDKLTDGLHNGEMIIVAGFPSTGKTALSVNIAVHNALKGVPFAIFSAEMRPVQLVVRSICSEARFNFHRVTTSDFQRMTVASSALAKSPLYIEQANRLTIGQVQATARRLKQKYGIQGAVVDYIQLLTGTGDNREQEISSISKGIKSMALELDMPVLALSQLNDDGKLRESRAMGQDGDSIWKLENDGDWQPTVQPIKLKVEKCRDGETGKVKLTFMKEYTRFESVARVSDDDVPAGSSPIEND